MSLTRGSVLERRKLNRQSPNARLTPPVALVALDVIAGSERLTDEVLARVADLGFEQRAVVDGDAKSAAIAAASIVAKVTRDRLMKRLALAHPGYGFERHMGYSVPEHFAALARLGPTIHHRRSFAPVAAKLAALGGTSDEVIAELLPL